MDFIEIIYDFLQLFCLPAQRLGGLRPYLNRLLNHRFASHDALIRLVHDVPTVLNQIPSLHELQLLILYNLPLWLWPERRQRKRRRRSRRRRRHPSRRARFPALTTNLALPLFLFLRDRNLRLLLHLHKLVQPRHVFLLRRRQRVRVHGPFAQRPSLKLLDQLFTLRHFIGQLFQVSARHRRLAALENVLTLESVPAPTRRELAPSVPSLARIPSRRVARVARIPSHRIARRTLTPRTPSAADLASPARSSRRRRPSIAPRVVGRRRPARPSRRLTPDRASAIAPSSRSRRRPIAIARSRRDVASRRRRIVASTRARVRVVASTRERLE